MACAGCATGRSHRRASMIPMAWRWRKTAPCTWPMPATTTASAGSAATVRSPRWPVSAKALSMARAPRRDSIRLPAWPWTAPAICMSPIPATTPSARSRRWAGSAPSPAPAWRASAMAPRRRRSSTGRSAWRWMRTATSMWPTPTTTASAGSIRMGRSAPWPVASGPATWVAWAPPPVSIRPPRWRWMRTASSGSPTPATTPSVASRPMAR